MKTIGERLKQERERLGLTQGEFAELAGVNKRSQINYEKGIRFPDARYLSKVMDAGVNIDYVLVGKGVDGHESQSKSPALGHSCNVSRYNVKDEPGTYKMKKGDGFLDDIEAFIDTQRACIDIIDGILKRIGFNDVSSSVKNTIVLLLQHGQITVQGAEAVLLVIRPDVVATKP